MIFPSLMIGALCALSPLALQPVSAQSGPEGLFAIWNAMTVQERTQMGLTFVQWYNREALKLMREVRQHTGLFTPSNLLQYLHESDEQWIESELGRFGHSLLGDLSASIYGDASESLQVQSGAPLADTFEHFLAIGGDFLDQNNIELDNLGQHVGEMKHNFDDFFHINGRGNFIISGIKSFLEGLGLDESSFESTGVDASYDVTEPTDGDEAGFRFFTLGEGWNVIIYVSPDIENGCFADSFPVDMLDLTTYKIVCIDTPLTTGNVDHFSGNDVFQQVYNALRSWILREESESTEACIKFNLVCRSIWSASCLMTAIDIGDEMNLETHIINPPMGEAAVQYFDELLFQPYIDIINNHGCAELRQTVFFRKVIENTPRIDSVLDDPLSCENEILTHMEINQQYLRAHPYLIGGSYLVDMANTGEYPPYGPIAVDFANCKRSPLIHPFDMVDILELLSIWAVDTSFSECNDYKYWHPDTLMKASAPMGPCGIAPPV